MQRSLPTIKAYKRKVINADKFRLGENNILYLSDLKGNFNEISENVLREVAPFLTHWGNYLAFKDESKIYVVEPLLQKENETLIRPRAENQCFGCGDAHTNGLYLTFLHDKSTKIVHSWLTPDERLQGGKGWMHGGFAALLLDEVMGKALSANGLGGAPTGKLSVSYRNPVRLGMHIELRAFVKKVEGRKFFVEGQIREFDEAGNGLILAESDGLFIKPKSQE